MNTDCTVNSAAPVSTTSPTPHEKIQVWSYPSIVAHFKKRENSPPSSAAAFSESKRFTLNLQKNWGKVPLAVRMLMPNNKTS